VDHPVVSRCAARTAECARKFLELDNNLARWESRLMDMLGTSRDSIARSRQLINDIHERNGK
jgi:hypothetical protein